MKQGIRILVSLSFLGFCFLSQGLAYDAIRDIRLRVKKLEQDIGAEEHALILLHDRHRAILEEKKRLANYQAQRKEAIVGALGAIEERQRFLRERQKAEEKLLQEKRNAMEAQKILMKAIELKNEEQAKKKEKQKKLEFINQTLDEWTRKKEVKGQ